MAIKRAMFLAAGLGTRLDPMTQLRPKPMLPVCDIPILKFGIANLRGHGITDIVINQHHLGDVIERDLGDGSELGVSIQYVKEPEILGTGGGLRNALHLLDPEGNNEPFLSLNGKLIFDVDITALVRDYESDPECLGMVVVRQVPDAQKWSALDVRPEGKGLRLHNVFGSGDHMFCGVHITTPQVVSRLPDGESCSIRQGYLPWIQKGERVRAFDAGGAYFAEHSTPERYLAGSIDLLSDAKLRYPPGQLASISDEAAIAADAQINGPVKIGSGAVIESGAVIGPHAVVGEKSTVRKGTMVARSVLWPGVQVDCDLKDAIATPLGVIHTKANA